MDTQVPPCYKINHSKYNSYSNYQRMNAQLHVKKNTFGNLLRVQLVSVL